MDFSNQPKWANWLCSDEFGNAKWFANEPVIDPKYWKYFGVGNDSKMKMNPFVKMKL